MADREAYAMLLDCDHDKLFALVTRLAGDLQRQRPQIVVTDAAEGYNPVHDLCKLIAGAAIEISETATTHLEYAVVQHPSANGGVLAVELDDQLYRMKIEQARRFAPLIPEVDDLLARYGADAYRRELLRPVSDWMHVDITTKPDYERFGEERGYAHVIRRDEHFVPLRDALCERVGRRSCVS